MSCCYPLRHWSVDPSGEEEPTPSHASHQLPLPVSMRSTVCLSGAITSDLHTFSFIRYNM